MALTMNTEPGLAMPALVRYRAGAAGKVPACLLLHLDGKDAALKHPQAAALLDAGWVVIAPDLRGTGETQPKGEAIGGAADHHSAEHAVWLGRPLLGQWLIDVASLLTWMVGQPGYRKDRLAVMGLGQAGLVALCRRRHRWTRACPASPSWTCPHRSWFLKHTPPARAWACWLPACCGPATSLSLPP